MIYLGHLTPLIVAPTDEINLSKSGDYAHPMREGVKQKHFSTLSVRPRSVLASRPLLLRGEDFGFNAWSVTECDRDMNRSCWSPLSDFMPRSDTIVAKLRKPAVGFKCQPSSYVRLEAYGFFGLSEGA